MKTCVVIPARFKSSRFPGKPLTLIKGKAMILRVAELSAKAVGKLNVFIATDNFKINNYVKNAGFNSIMTNTNNLTGTDRVAEASKNLKYDIYVNVQGDEPLINPDDILEAIKFKKKYPSFVINSFCFLNNEEDPMNKNIPKVVTDEKNNLIYISRSVIPASKKETNSYKYKKQVCIYAYNKEELSCFYNFGRKSKVESIEDIEILRFFELGINIKMYEAKTKTIAVDIPSDVEKVESYLEKNYKC
tara:strand:- start:1816 stop:2553 length:738 start_codon:yes stop_codon:yes gene_type:complete